jgi:hypothetical protein
MGTDQIKNQRLAVTGKRERRAENGPWGVSFNGRNKSVTKNKHLHREARGTSRTRVPERQAQTQNTAQI